MRRLKDILNRSNRAYLLEVIGRRRDYYRNRLQCHARRNRVIKRYLSSTGRRRLHLGSGGHLLHGWLNSDILDLRKGMIFLDVRERFPFEDCTFDLVYSEHLLEHLSYSDGGHLLKESFRILKPGGTCRISTPDLSFLISVWKDDTEDNRQYLKWAFDTYWRASRPSKALAMNYYLTGWGHKCVYDLKLLTESCREAGFIDIKKREVGESDVADLEGIERHGNVIGDRWNRKESLVIEAGKAGANA